MLCGHKWKKIRRFATQWLLFGIYVLVCACLFIMLEDESQQFREIERVKVWNQTRERILSLLISNSTCYSFKGDYYIFSYYFFKLYIYIHNGPEN